MSRVANCCTLATIAFPLDQPEIQLRSPFCRPRNGTTGGSKTAGKSYPKRSKPLRTRVQNLMRPIVTNRKVTNVTTDSGSRYGILVTFEFHKSGISLSTQLFYFDVEQTSGEGCSGVL